MKRLLICGSRRWRNREAIYTVLREHRPDLVIEGGAPGADRIAHEEALALGIPVRQFRADWKRYGRAAGPIRNERMLHEGKPTAVAAFVLPSSKGSWHMIEIAETAGIEVVVFYG